ncbi:MAG: glycosyltransferase family 2 protein [Nanoarchaeota archaeon]|nr:glycosyltransferase family 2 protein [Nanoarchaeota archaeon]
MKGPFSIWAFFGLTLWIDILTHLIFPFKEKTVNPYKPIKKVSVVVPVHKEPEDYIKFTIDHIYKERYPLFNVIICGDSESQSAKLIVKNLSKQYKNLHYIESPQRSKAKKVNYIANSYSNLAGDFIYVRDCRVKGTPDCIEKIVSYFSAKDVAAVTSYGRVSVPKNSLSRAYFYGKAWINEVGRFRKNAQEKRRAVFVVCGASTMYRTLVLQKIPLASGTKTEDTHYTWILQKKGYRIRVADDALVSAPEVDGEKMQGINNQLKQAYRWSSGTMQCLYREGGQIFKSKSLALTTIFPGFLEAVMYSIPLALLPLFFFVQPVYALGFFVGDTVFSLLGTLIILPKKFLKTLIHYPEIIFFKYLNALVFICALSVTTYQAVMNKTDKWTNEWTPPPTNLIQNN